MIERVTYKPIPTGAYKGHIGYYVSLDEKPLDVERLAKTLEVIEAHKTHRLKVIVLEDEYYEYDEVGIMTALKTFKDYGWYIYIASPGTRYRQWYREANWMSIRLDDTAWAPFNVSEVVFPFIRGATEPILPKAKNNLFLYLLTDDKDTKHAFTWIKEAENNWTLEPNGLEGIYWQHKEELL